jgi:H+/Cl- antiporter ClcA
MSPQTGKLLIFLGLGLVVVGVLVYFLHDRLHWLGRLPGDIRIERENFRLYVPLATCLLLTLLVNLILWLVRRFF